MRMLFMAIVGSFIGLIAGLLVATLFNVNCDSFTEALQGCRRLESETMALYGASGGGILGLLAGAMWRR